MGLNHDDWKEIENLVQQAQRIVADPGDTPASVRGDAVSFYTLGLAILDVHKRITTIAQLMDSAMLASNKPPKSKLIVPYGT